jgi:hypothetical protein
MTTDEKARRFERALALAGNTHTGADVMDKVRANRAQCWNNGDSVIITEVLVYPRVKACNYWLLCGNLQECLELQSEIDAWAIGEGCSVATATGRMGWLHVTKMPLGTAWRPRAVQFVKSLQS